jgi:acyl carrier protein
MSGSTVNAKRSEIEAKVIRIAAETCGADASQVTLESNFVTDLNYDSLELVEFTMSLEEEFDVPVPDEQAERIATVGQAVEALLVAMSAAGGK